jgi:hypothetical protein
VHELVEAQVLKFEHELDGRARHVGPAAEARERGRFSGVGADLGALSDDPVLRRKRDDVRAIEARAAVRRIAPS